MEIKLYKLFNKPEYKTVMNEISDFIKNIYIKDNDQIIGYLEDLKIKNKFVDYILFFENNAIIIVFDDEYIFKINLNGNIERICDK